MYVFTEYIYIVLQFIVVMNINVWYSRGMCTFLELQAILMDCTKDYSVYMTEHMASTSIAAGVYIFTCKTITEMCMINYYSAFFLQNKGF